MGSQLIRRQGGGGRRRRHGRAGSRMTDINVTPMVDVMMVLLIIFMVAAPMLTVGVPIELPQTAASALPNAEEEPLSVTLTADGLLLVQSAEVEADALVPTLRAVAAERTSDRLFLRADGAIPYARVMQVMGALNAAGFRNIGLVTDPGGPSMDTAARP